MQTDNLNKYHFILASASPRRQFLLRELGLNFDIQTIEVEETYPLHLQREQIPLYLAAKKADAFPDSFFSDQTLVITADTIVWLNGQNLGKPKDHNAAIRMLGMLAGNRHEVITGMCLRSKDKTVSFYDITDVWFKPLTKEEIEFYVERFRPFDKAGAYGVQEWIGYVAVTRVDGSFFNVMGLPIHRFYEELLRF
ncbi:MAG: Maf family nucleotide pyrophosphatase [Bacteroidetes bacterium]|nr:Maf family nucleotide pyrophosphatase [Bacteroidota bacterium]